MLSVDSRRKIGNVFLLHEYMALGHLTNINKVGVRVSKVASGTPGIRRQC